MANFLTQLIITISLLVIASSSYANVFPVALEKRSGEANQIIIAKAIAKESYWDGNQSSIYTAYTMESIAFLKEGTINQTFQLILPGGEVDGEMEVVSPNVAIDLGQEYLVFVENAPANVLNPRASAARNRQQQFTPYSFVQGVIPYVDGAYVDLLGEAPVSEDLMVEKIKEVTQVEPHTPMGESYIPRPDLNDVDGDGVCASFDCDDNDPNFPKPIGAACDDGNAETLNDVIQADGCTCAGDIGQPLNCSAFNPPTVEGNIIRITSLNAHRERVTIVDTTTNEPPLVVCDGDCAETEFIEDLDLGIKKIDIWMYDALNDSCHLEFYLSVDTILCWDADNDSVCNIKDCEPFNADFPSLVGTPCDDGNPNTIGDIILANGCGCAGVMTCPVDSSNFSGNSTSNRGIAITLKNGKGEVDPIFYAGSVAAEDDLIIEGSGFGNAIGRIEFPNSDNGGRSVTIIQEESDIISWTNTQIRVKIPVLAGSGIINVRNSTLNLIGSAPIDISWSLNSLYSTFKDYVTKTRQLIRFKDANGAGGYTIHLDEPSGFAASEAIPGFERAVHTWVCHSGVNWQIDKTSTTGGFANDGNSVVLYAPNLPIGLLAVTTSRYKASGNSLCNYEKTLWYLKEFDIQILPPEAMGTINSWNFTTDVPTSTQFDFETIALHELGHAHGLAHVINEEELMHFSIQAGKVNRVISPHAHEGGAYKMSISTEPFCMFNHQPMVALEATCSPNNNNIVSTAAKIKLMLEGYYDKGTKELKTLLLDNELLPKEQPIPNSNSGDGQAITISTFPVGVVDWLKLELRAADNMMQVVAEKLVLIKSDGNLVDVNGNEIITFEGIEDQSYYIAAHHKSHLPIISNSAQPLSDNPPLYDFSASEYTTMGSNQQKLIDGKYFMSVGDFDGNGIINSLDFNIWKQAGAGINAYSPADADCNGIINNQDFNLWKQNGSKISVLSQ